jgi:hypothetical protein
MQAASRRPYMLTLFLVRSLQSRSREQHGNFIYVRRRVFLAEPPDAAEGSLQWWFVEGLPQTVTSMEHFEYTNFGISH